MTPVLITILKGLQIVAASIVAGEQLALEIKSHFELSPDFSVNVSTLTSDAINVNEDTLTLVNAYRHSIGLNPLPESASVIPAHPLAIAA